MHVVDLKMAGDGQVGRRAGKLGIEGDHSMQSEAVLIEQPRHFFKRAAFQLYAHVERFAIPVSAHEKMPEAGRSLIGTRRRAGEPQLHRAVIGRRDIEIGVV